MTTHGLLRYGFLFCRVGGCSKLAALSSKSRLVFGILLKAFLDPVTTALEMPRSSVQEWTIKT